MSFSQSAAGSRDNVRGAITDEKNALKAYGGDLGQLTAEYIDHVLELVGEDRDVFVETNGHAGTSTSGGPSAQVTLRILTVY